MRQIAPPASRRGRTPCARRVSECLPFARSLRITRRRAGGVAPYGLCGPGKRGAWANTGRRLPPLRNHGAMWASRPTNGRGGKPCRGRGPPRPAKRPQRTRCGKRRTHGVRPYRAWGTPANPCRGGHWPSVVADGLLIMGIVECADAIYGVPTHTPCFRFYIVRQRCHVRAVPCEDSKESARVWPGRAKKTQREKT